MKKKKVFFSVVRHSEEATEMLVTVAGRIINDFKKLF